MEYSAASASLAIGGAVIVIPFLLAGFGAVVYVFRQKNTQRESSAKSTTLLQIPLGFLFAAAAIWSLSTGIADTQKCRMAEKQGDFEVVAGPVHVVKRFSKPGYGYVEFSVGPKELKTYESGLQCDCGYIFPLGKTIQLEEGMNVEAKVQGATVIALKVKEAN